ncbi:MAG: hypothetical protein ACK4MV_01675 [Beijerinckiaceae bacterium]
MGKQPQPARTQQRETISAPSRDLGLLPERVRAMRDLILEAAQSGDIEELRPAIERNETLPIFSTGAERPRTFADAIDFLKKRSFDGQGRETLAIVAAIFEQSYVKITRGPAVTYEWPAFGKEHSDDERREIWRCMRFADLASSTDAPPKIERIGVGADGTWHYFVAGD